jgi:hypothetical protein
MITRISSKGEVPLPLELRRRDQIEPGQQFEIERVRSGEYRLVRIWPPANQGLVDWLLECPEKGFFVPVASEWTDTF